MAATPAKTCEQVSSTLSSLTRKRLVPFCKDTFFLFSSGIVLSRSNFNYTRSPDISTMKAWSTAPPSGSYTQSRLLPLYKLGSSRSNKKQWCLVKQTLSNLLCLTCGIWMENFFSFSMRELLCISQRIVPGRVPLVVWPPDRPDGVVAGVQHPLQVATVARLRLFCNGEKV